MEEVEYRNALPHGQLRRLRKSRIKGTNISSKLLGRQLLRYWLSMARDIQTVDEQIGDTSTGSADGPSQSPAACFDWTPEAQPSPGIHLKNQKEQTASLFALAGFTAFLFGLMTMVFLVHGNWGGLGLLIFPALILGGAKFCCHLAPDDYVILYSDRMVLPGEGSRTTEIIWSEIETIRWPRASGKEGPTIRIERGGNRRRLPIFFRMNSLAIADRIMLIRYLRLAGAAARHENWPVFCHKFAGPLLEQHLRQQESENDSDATTAAGASTSPGIAQSFTLLYSHHPFLAGMFSPLFLAYLVPRVISRAMCWTTAAVVAISALINIRLVCGQWISPVSEICFAFAGGLFLLGLLGRREARSPENDQASVGLVVFCLSAALIGVPLLAHLAAVGWFPKGMMRWLVLLGYLLLHSPLFVYLWRERRREQSTPPEVYEEAVRRWDTLEQSGRLPESARVGEQG